MASASGKGETAETMFWEAIITWSASVSAGLAAVSALVLAAVFCDRVWADCKILAELEELVALMIMASRFLFESLSRRKLWRWRR